MVVGGIIGNFLILIAVSLAIWSLWWIVKGSLTNTDERNAEVEARQRFVEDGHWAEGPRPVPFTDDELARLSDALAPVDPAEAGIEARPAPPQKRRPFGSNRRP